MIIFMVVQYDFSFDKYEPGRERIYRIVSEGDTWKNAGVPAPLHEAVQHQVSGIENTAAFFDYSEWSTKVAIPKGNSKAPQLFKKQDKMFLLMVITLIFFHTNG